jgi:hypothetical protein
MTFAPPMYANPTPDKLCLLIFTTLREEVPGKKDYDITMKASILVVLHISKPVQRSPEMLYSRTGEAAVVSHRPITASVPVMLAVGEGFQPIDNLHDIRLHAIGSAQSLCMSTRAPRNLPCLGAAKHSVERNKGALNKP